MQLMLRRSHRVRFFGRGLIYSTAVHVLCSQAEIAAIYSFSLEGTLLYSRLEMADRGTGLLGFLFRSFVFEASNLTITVADALAGKRVEFDDFSQALAVEDLIVAGVSRFNDLLDAARGFRGIEILPV